MINTRNFNNKWFRRGAYQKKLIDKNKVDKQGPSFAYLLFNGKRKDFLNLGGFYE